MLNATELVDRLLHEVAPEADIGALDPDGLLQEQIDFDSLDFLHLATALGAATGRDIPERDYPLLATLGGMYEYVADIAGSG